MDCTGSRSVPIRYYFCGVEFSDDGPGRGKGGDDDVDACYGNVFRGTGDKALGAVGEGDTVKGVKGTECQESGGNDETPDEEGCATTDFVDVELRRDGKEEVYYSGDAGGEETALARGEAGLGEDDRCKV